MNSSILQDSAINCADAGEGHKPVRVLSVEGVSDVSAPHLSEQRNSKAWGYFAVNVSLLNLREDQALDKPLKAMVVSSFLDAFSGDCRLFWKILFNQMQTAELNTVVIEWNAMGYVILQTDELIVSAGLKIWMDILRGFYKKATPINNYSGW